MPVISFKLLCYQYLSLLKESIGWINANLRKFQLATLWSLSMMVLVMNISIKLLKLTKLKVFNWVHHYCICIRNHVLRISQNHKTANKQPAFKPFAHFHHKLTHTLPRLSTVLPAVAPTKNNRYKINNIHLFHVLGAHTHKHSQVALWEHQPVINRKTQRSTTFPEKGLSRTNCGKKNRTSRKKGGKQIDFHPLLFCNHFELHTSRSGAKRLKPRKKTRERENVPPVFRVSVCVQCNMYVCKCVLPPATPQQQKSVWKFA